jgi:hypothetical protein
MKKNYSILIILPLICTSIYGKNNLYMNRCEQILTSIYTHYSIKDSPLLKETYPLDADYKATYLASDDKQSHNQYSYLWPYSGTFSAVNALTFTTAGKAYRHLLDKRVLPGLEKYFDTKRIPYAYSSYITDAKPSDRFYDDNIWLGIDFTGAYLHHKERKYLEKAELIWKFIESGMDNTLGGGVYWCEQKRKSKNTCSNAPASVLAFKLFEATGDSLYFSEGKELYDWTKKHLQDNSDHLYYDNINLDGHVSKEKYSYNSGQMLQAAALLYKITKNKEYLKEAQQVAKSCYNYFFEDFTSNKGIHFKMIKKGNVWFTAVMLRGFIELYKLDKNPFYINAYKNSLDYVWIHARDKDGLFDDNFTEIEKNKKKWLLTQAAFAEMYARIAAL